MSEDVKQFIVGSLQEMSYDVGDVPGDTPLGPSGLDVDSLSTAELAVRVEDAYGVKFYEDEMERVITMTVDEFVAEVQTRSEAVAAENLAQ